MLNVNYDSLNFNLVMKRKENMSRQEEYFPAPLVTHNFRFGGEEDVSSQ